MIFAKHWAASLDDYAIDLAWSPDGNVLAAASAAGGNCLAWMPQAGSQPSASGPQLPLATGGQDGCVRFWDATTGAQTAEVKLGNAWVEHLAWSPAGSALAPTSVPDPTSPTPGPGLLFAAAGKKLVALRPDGSVAHTFPDAPKTISALAWKPDGSTCAAACFGHVAVWDATTFAAWKEFPYGNAIYALTWSPDGRWLVAGCHDNAVHLWAPAEADLELHMSGYETRLKELSFSQDSKWLATGGGRDACVWDCSGAGPEGREPLLLPHNARVCALAFQNSHGLLAAGAANGEFTLWMPTRKNPMVAEVTMPSPATRFAWRGDDALLAVGTEKGQVFVFKTA